MGQPLSPIGGDQLVLRTRPTLPLLRVPQVVELASYIVYIAEKGREFIIFRPRKFICVEGGKSPSVLRFFPPN